MLNKPFTFILISIILCVGKTAQSTAQSLDVTYEIVAPLSENSIPQSNKLQFNKNVVVKQDLYANAVSSSLGFIKNMLEVGERIITNEIESKQIDSSVIYVDVIKSKTGKIVIEGNLVIADFGAPIDDEDEIIEDGIASNELTTSLRQWKMIYHDDFEDDQSLVGWSTTETTSCGKYVHFLGGDCILSYQDVVKQYTGIGAHSHVRIQAKLNIFNDWNSNSIYVLVNDELVWSKMIPTVLASSTNPKNVCQANVKQVEFGYPIDIIIKDNESSIKLTIGSTLEGDPCEASYGIDDVMISIR